MKKLFSIILTIAIIICTLPIGALTASAASYSGMCGKNLTYIFDDTTGILIISGKGDMTDYSYNNTPWNSYRTLIKEVVISGSVTSIGHSAFCYCTNLIKVTIPDSMQEIWDDAFYRCKSLTNITIPNSVTSIGDDVFSYCTSLSSIEIPDSVKSIGDNAFRHCTSLSSIEIPTV
ncbi:MAG: leucine-rich repeat domain-containing protein [Clostridia bacterium]|nr:leucine-rich repeat domain-containing protein [Clostridia bacterium]